MATSTWLERESPDRPGERALQLRGMAVADSHRRTVLKQFSDGTNPFPFVYNYRFTILNNENVWAKAMSRVTNDKWTPEKAVDEMIARIKAVAG